MKRWLLLLVLNSPLMAETERSISGAAQAQDWPAVKALSAGRIPSDRQPDGMTALHWAVAHQNREAVALLLAAKADADALTDYRISPLHIACTLPDAEIVRMLLEGGSGVQRTQLDSATPLMIAARTGVETSVRYLLQHGARPDAAERRGQTALMWAAAAGHVQAVDALIDAKAKLDTATRTGFTAMMFAARDGRLQVVERLLDAGVDVSSAMKPSRRNGRTPRSGTSALTLAVESGHFELAMLLVRRGADPNDQRSGFTPLHALVNVRKPGRGENPNGDPPPRGSGNLTSLQFVREIVAAGADVNARLKRGKRGRAVLSHEGATPFLLAGKTADMPYLQLLLELGADPLLTNVDGCTPLMAAAGVGVRAVGEEAGSETEVIETINFCVNLGMDVNTVDDNKETAMHGAAYRNFPAVVECLRRHGAVAKAWNHKNKSGWTPMMIAQGHRPGSFKPSLPTVAALRQSMQ